MGFIGVSIHHVYNGIYKIYDSHARDEYGTKKPSLGTCVLLEVPSIQGLAQYVQAISLYQINILLITYLRVSFLIFRKCQHIIMGNAERKV